MLLIVEIAMTVWAWKKGWAGWALMPLALCIAAGFAIGVALGASGGTVEDLGALPLLLDGLCIVSLGVMGAHGRKAAPQQTRQEA